MSSFLKRRTLGGYALRCFIVECSAHRAQDLTEW
jgi:hypothetical protein